jgi:hypothetical protein
MKELLMIWEVNYTSYGITLCNEEQARNDYEKKLKDQAMNYEKLISGLKSG